MLRLGSDNVKNSPPLTVSSLLINIAGFRRKRSIVKEKNPLFKKVNFSGGDRRRIIWQDDKEQEPESKINPPQFSFTILI